MAKSLGWAGGGLLALLVWASVCRAADYDAGGALPSRGRAAALLTALFYHDAATDSTAAANTGYGVTEPDGITRFPSTSIRVTLNAVERTRIMQFARSLVYEGGYYPKEIYQLLGYKDVNAARLGRLTRQMDAAMGKRPSPWEVAGRVGRSGMRGSSDHWSMAPGDAGEAGLSTPGTLAYLPALAVVYAAYPEDGMEAAAQLATLKDDDIRAAPVARVALSLLQRVLVAETHDKDAWLRAASIDCADADTEHDVRAVRVKDWRYLRGEECAMGRLERAVYVWYNGNGYTDIMAEGRRRLRSRESLAYLASLAAVTYGSEGLPDAVVAHGAADRSLLEMVNDLHDLATSEAVLRVAKDGEEE